MAYRARTTSLPARLMRQHQRNNTVAPKQYGSTKARALTRVVFICPHTAGMQELNTPLETEGIVMGIGEVSFTVLLTGQVAQSCPNARAPLDRPSHL